MGVKSTALRFGDSTREWLSGFGLACIGSLALSGLNAELGNGVPFMFMFLFLLVNVGKNNTFLPVTYSFYVASLGLQFFT